jgi:septum formation protein
LPHRLPIVLASASPRRQQLLRDAGLDFVVHPADISEVPFAGEIPSSFAARMAKEKARAVLSTMADRVILAADTVVAVQKEILGKPRDAEDAARMLQLLSNRTHHVITGVCLAGNRFEDVRHETTAVTFLPITEAGIRAYISTAEPMDKAGAYAIQGNAARWVSKIDGDYNNVVGLPVEMVLRMLRERGVL